MGTFFALFLQLCDIPLYSNIQNKRSVNGSYAHHPLFQPMNDLEERVGKLIRYIIQLLWEVFMEFIFGLLEDFRSIGIRV